MSKTTKIRYVPWLGTVSREVDTGVSEIETEGLEAESEELGAICWQTCAPDPGRLIYHRYVIRTQA